MINLSGRDSVLSDKLQFVVMATFVDKLKFVGLHDSMRTDRDVYFQDSQGASQII